MAKRWTRARVLDAGLPIYQIKITLADADPPIWRRVLTHNCTLEGLHDIIQSSMGWDDEHLYAFSIGKRQFSGGDDWDGAFGPDFGFGSKRSRDGNPAKVWLSDLVAEGNRRLTYEYDFGDSWIHQIDIERTLPIEKGVFYPCCVGGERACPPEDCGGIPGYENLLLALEDPENEDYEEYLDWIDPSFDPAAFDLENVNRQFRHLRRWLVHRKGKNLPRPAFPKGALVRVKRGAFHFPYTDLPLGGWEGTLTQVARGIPIEYEVRWTERTLAAVPEVYRKRCQRDEDEPATTWVAETDLELASPDEPLDMEQPTQIVTQPLSMDDPDDRVRAALGLTSDDPLPRYNEDIALRYLEYLREHLVFPFEAEHIRHNDFTSYEGVAVTVEGFADPPLDQIEALMCMVREEASAEPMRVPLSSLSRDENDDCSQHLETYKHWLWEVQDWLSAKDSKPDEDETYGDEDGESDYDEDGDEDDCDEDDYDEDEEDEDEDDEDEDDEDEDEEGDEEYDEDDSFVSGLPGPVEFPFGTMALYGPDDVTTTKIAAGVILHAGAEPVIRRWVASNVLESEKVQREVGEFFDQYGVKGVAAVDRNIGCPHEEGKDFPLGGDCPFCPFWKGKQGSGARP